MLNILMFAQTGSKNGHFFLQATIFQLYFMHGLMYPFLTILITMILKTTFNYSLYRKSVNFSNRPNFFLRWSWKLRLHIWAYQRDHFVFMKIFFSEIFYFSRYRRRKIKLSELNKQWELLAFEPLFFQRKCLLEPQENNQETWESKNTKNV